jgi:hypothetical protein
MWLVLLLLLLPIDAAAQPIPSCTALEEGAVACLSGKLCRCRFEPGGSMTQRPSGHRWDCGALRPACGEALNPPATLAPGQPLPFDPLLLLPPPPGLQPRR